MISLTMDLNNKQSLEKIILIKILGIVNALEENLITIEEAEKILFSPYTIELLKTKKMSNEVLDILILGTELEDVLSLIPDKLNDSLSEIKQLSFQLLKQKNKYEIDDKVLR